MSWDGNERRAKDAHISHIATALEEHTKEDAVRFAEIITKLHKLDISISNLMVLNTETLKSQMSLVSASQLMLNKHNEFLFGDTNGNKGAAIRLDRLEGAEESRKWTFRAMWAAIVTLLTKVFYDVISRK